MSDLAPLDDRAMACDVAAECVNGPEPHEFVHNSGRHVAADDLVWPCSKQSWERE